MRYRYSERKFDVLLLITFLYAAAIIFIVLFTWNGNTFFAEKYGYFIFSLRGHDNPTLELAYGKIIIYSLLATTPMFLCELSFRSRKLIKFISFLYIISLIGTIVAFYFLSQDAFASIPHYQNNQENATAEELLINGMFNWIKPFANDLGNIYVWYATPVVYSIAAGLAIGFFGDFNSKGGRKCLFFLFVFFPLIIALPILLLWLSGAITTVVWIIGIAITLTVIALWGKGMARPEGPTYHTENGRTIKKNSFGEYTDEYGKVWETDDNGKSFHEK